MDQNSTPPIFILSYANTEYKIQVLKECVQSVKKIGLPVISISNLELETDVLDLFDDYVTGENETCCFGEFFSDSEIDLARMSSRFFIYFTTPWGDTINYKQLSYGRGCTYHWSALNQFNIILQYCKKKNIDYFLTLEGDCVIDDEDLPKINEYFETFDREKFDFCAMIGNLFYYICANVLILRTSYLERSFENVSCEDFLKSTYPNFAAESYLFERLLKNGGKGKIFMFNSDKRDFLPESCVVERKFVENENDGLNPIKLFFPNTKKMYLSVSTDRMDQSPLEPLKYVEIGLGTKNNEDVFFTWNKYNGSSVERVSVQVNIFNGSTIIFSNLYDMPIGTWHYTPIFNLTMDSHCEITMKVLDINKKEFHTTYRFKHLKIEN